MSGFDALWSTDQCPILRIEYVRFIYKSNGQRNLNKFSLQITNLLTGYWSKVSSVFGILSCYKYLNFILEQATKAQKGAELCLYSFFNFGSRMGGWSTPRSGQFATVIETRYTLYRRLVGPQGRSGRVWKIFPPHRDSIPGPSGP